MPTTSPRLWLILGGLTAGGLAGCATLQLPWDKNRIPQATARNPVVRMVCLWEQSEGRDPDGLPCRGFAGQILFLSNRNAMPVQAHGAVRIYLFDDVGDTDEQSKPLRQFDFSTEAWQVHLTKSAIGPSYSVFVPYVRRGQHNAQCSLRIRLTPKEGPKIFSDVTTLPLRGPTDTEETTIISDPSGSEKPLQANVNAALSQVIQKSTTIPLTTTNSGRLTLANSVPTATASPLDDRLTRMERLLAQALTERAQTPSLAPGASGVQPAGYETESVSPEPPGDTSPPLRFNLNQNRE